MQHLTAPELHTRLQQAPAPQLIDVREDWEFAIGHIAGAQSIPLGQIPAAVQNFNADDELVMICHHGMRSLQAADYLAQHGFTQLINLTGGIDAWSREVDPNIPTY